MSNFTEYKVPPDTLPDPLVMAGGKKVTTPEVWIKERRPEILTFYRTEIYGTVPANAPKVTWEVAETDDTARKGAAAAHLPPPTIACPRAANVRRSVHDAGVVSTLM